MGLLLLFGLLVVICIWMELLCRTILRAASERSVGGWAAVALVVAAPVAVMRGMP